MTEREESDMKERDKIVLKRQLEEQASRLQQQDDMELVISSVDTAAALMKSAVQNIPDDLDSVTFDRTYAGMLRAQNQINTFCAMSEKRLEESHNQYIQEKKEQVFAFEEKKASYRKMEEDALKETQEARIACETEKVKAQQAKETLSSVQRELQDYQQTQSFYLQQSEANQKKIQAMREERDTIQKETEHLQDRLNAFVQQIEAIKATREDLKSYQEEVLRIQTGINMDGYVDEDTLNKTLNQRREEGEKLILEYDEILSRVYQDVEKLKEKIAKRNLTNKQE